MARPLRFRHSTSRWTEQRVRSELLGSLDANLGAEMSRPWFALSGGYEARRFDMDNGDTALFAWGNEEAYWLGNTETPSALWRTEKYDFGNVPQVIAEWAEREFLAELLDDEPWLKAYPHLATFFLPVLCSKDGRESTRSFFRDHAAGFPETDRDVALSYYEEFLADGTLDPYRHEMAGKLGTSEALDLTRMAATMSEFTVARLLSLAGYDIVPEIEVTTGHSIDYRASRNGESALVEVTRPGAPAGRQANTPAAALKETVETKTNGQLEAHAGGVTLFVDCSHFSESEWQDVLETRPSFAHRPVVVFFARPGRAVQGFSQGSYPLELDGTVRWR